MYLSATIENGKKTKILSLIQGLEYLNITKNKSLLLDRNNPEHLKVIDEIKSQIEYKLNNCTFNGFLSKIGEGHLKQALYLLSKDNSKITIGWDRLNN